MPVFPHVKVDTLLAETNTGNGDASTSFAGLSYRQ